MSPFDLTNLAALKAWLGLPPAPGPNDATLSALVTAASRSIYAALSRPSLLPWTHQRYDNERLRPKCSANQICRIVDPDRDSLYLLVYLNGQHAVALDHLG
jgi:hypothetical protein